MEEDVFKKHLKGSFITDVGTGKTKQKVYEQHFDCCVLEGEIMVKTNKVKHFPQNTSEGRWGVWG